MATLKARFESFASEKPPSSLAVFDKSSRSRTAVLKFQNHRCLGKFCTTDNGTYSIKGTRIPNLIPDFMMHNLRGSYLGTGRGRAVIIPEYQDFHELKQKFFLKWMLDSNFFAGVAQGTYRKPDFICFGRCIYITLMTPGITLRADWEVYAVKIHDVIYLWSEVLTESRRVMETYYGIYFEHLLTHANPRDSSPNEYEKVFVVNEMRFGSHQLLCLSEIEAQDESGEWVEIKSFKQCSPKGSAAKHLKFWAQTVVAGVKSIIVGKRDDNGYLSHIETTTTEDLEFMFDWNPRLCYDFQNRLLIWMKSHFTESNPKKFKKFAWPSGSPFVYSSDVRQSEVPKAFLPPWFLESLKK